MKKKNITRKNELDDCRLPVFIYGNFSFSCSSSSNRCASLVVGECGPVSRNTSHDPKTTEVELSTWYSKISDNGWFCGDDYVRVKDALEKFQTEGKVLSVLEHDQSCIASNHISPLKRWCFLSDKEHAYQTVKVPKMPRHSHP